ncbi:hypothetical protein QO010_002129 [Caulobacter ginsengisoli]|uniref:Uncharacterized protein n=1 Tax=Caulobacter ginsengisoli TaxID=400775 RepID=A0ABU0IQR1_9CAUL|nr:hypothetical protein [Caulobacter ginsengisoli]MDQ0464348.1 hypothetical protein [Caulobacter ginsengisoli]
MLTRRLLLAALAAPAIAAAPLVAPDGGPGLSLRGQKQVARLRAAIRAKQARQAVLPTPRSDAELLVRLADLEQTAREALYGLDLDGMAADERQATLDAAWALVEAVDRRNQLALKAILPADGGWFGRTAYGEDAARAAWLITVHAVNDRRLMREAASRMAPLVATGEIEPAWYASVVDRLAVLEGRPQRFGTQPVCRAGVWTVGEVEDPAGLEARRASLGLRSMARGDFRPPPGC